jgi:protease-4
MRVFRFFAKALLAVFALVGAVVVLGSLAAALSWRVLPGLINPVPQRAVLQLDLADGVVETWPENPLARASMGEAVRLRDLVQSLDAAGRDPRVKGIVARLGAGPLGMARAQEIRDAIIAFRHQGKFAIAFAESFGEAGDGNAHYYLATAFDRIWLQPSGAVELTGPMIESPFLKDALALIGIEPQLDQREEYKGGMDMFTAAGMSEPQRQNLQALVDSWQHQLAEGIAAYRKGTPGEALALMDRGPFLAAEAKAAGLVDRLAYWDEIDNELSERASEDATLYPLASYVERLPEPPKDAPRIAIVYGLGEITLSSGDGNPLLDHTAMAADATAKALAAAIDDPGIKAIVFRVDSPGGSYVASDTIRREVERARTVGKPVVVSMGDLAASGGYFVSAPAQSIVAQPGTITGSIGVFGGKPVLAGLWQKLGIGWGGVQAGANADFASLNRPYSAAGWSFLQRSLDGIYADFMAKVASDRKLSADDTHAAAKGQIWSGADAKARGLVDELGGLATALAMARGIAQIPAAAPIRLEQFPAEGSGFGTFMRHLFGIGGSAARLAVALQHFEVLAGPALRLADSLAVSQRASLRLPALETAP